MGQELSRIGMNHDAAFTTSSRDGQQGLHRSHLALAPDQRDQAGRGASNDAN